MVIWVRLTGSTHVHDVDISSLAQRFLVAFALRSDLLGPHIAGHGHVDVVTFLMCAWLLQRVMFSSAQPLRGAKLSPRIPACAREHRFNIVSRQLVINISNGFLLSLLWAHIQAGHCVAIVTDKHRLSTSPTGLTAHIQLPSYHRQLQLPGHPIQHRVEYHPQS